MVVTVTGKFLKGEGDGGVSGGLLFKEKEEKPAAAFQPVLLPIPTWHMPSAAQVSCPSYSYRFEISLSLQGI